MRRLMAVLLLSAFLVTGGHSSGIVTTMIDNGGCIINVDLWVVNDPSQPDTGDNVLGTDSLTGKVGAGSGKINIRIRVQVDPANCQFCPNDICTYRVSGMYYNRLNQHLASQDMSVTRNGLTSGTYDFAPNWGNQNGGAWEITDNTVNPSLGLAGLRGRILIQVQALYPCYQHMGWVDKNVSFVGDRAIEVWACPENPCTLGDFDVQVHWVTSEWESNATATTEFIPQNWNVDWENSGVGELIFTDLYLSVPPKTQAARNYAVVVVDGTLPANPKATIRGSLEDDWGRKHAEKEISVAE